MQGVYLGGSSQGLFRGIYRGFIQRVHIGGSYYGFPDGARHLWRLAAARLWKICCVRGHGSDSA